MGTKDPRIDAYIAKQADFARPILEHLRDLVHATCPNVEEKVKWGMPHFDYAGGPLCHMAGFKAHCAFGFWKGALLFEDGAKAEQAMGHFGRITSIRELPPKKKLAGYITAAMKLNEEGVKNPSRTKTSAERIEIDTPPELAAALTRNSAARRHFDAFPPGRRREYNAWIAEAKTDATRAKRVAQAVEWIAEGKARNWKYER